MSTTSAFIPHIPYMISEEERRRGREEYERKKAPYRAKLEVETE